MDKRRVVVTGIGVASSLGCDVESFWRRLVRGDSGVVKLEDPEFASFPTPVGARAQGYVEADYFEVKEVRRTSRTSQLAVVAATQAVAQARLVDGGVDRQEAAVLIGSSIGGFSACDHAYRDFYLKGRQARAGSSISFDRTRRALQAVMTPRVNIESAPPARATSSVPDRIIWNACPTLWVPDAQAPSTLKRGPPRPNRMDTLAAGPLFMEEGMVRGLARPFR